MMMSLSSLFLTFCLCIQVSIDATPVKQKTAFAQYYAKEGGNIHFSYNHEGTDGGSFRTERHTPTGVVGSYGLRVGDGRYRTVRYVADDKGFRASISSNEQGLHYSAPADVLVAKRSGPLTWTGPIQASAPLPLSTFYSQTDQKLPLETHAPLSHFYSSPAFDSQRVPQVATTTLPPTVYYPQASPTSTTPDPLTSLLKRHMEDPEGPSDKHRSVFCMAKADTTAKDKHNGGRRGPHRALELAYSPMTEPSLDDLIKSGKAIDYAKCMGIAYMYSAKDGTSRGNSLVIPEPYDRHSNYPNQALNLQYSHAPIATHPAVGEQNANPALKFDTKLYLKGLVV